MELYILTFCVVLFSSLLSGMSGGGGGFVMTPYFLLMGLTPQQNIAVGSVIGLGLSGGSLFAVRGKQVVDRARLMPLLLFAILGTTISMFILPHLHAALSDRLIAWFVLLMTPTLFVNRGMFAPGERSRLATLVGYGLYTLLWLANGVFSAGFAGLLFIPLLFCLGLTAIEANVAKRFGALAQAIVLFAVLAPQGLIKWNYAVASLAGSWVGGHLGTHLAIRNGERFARVTLATVMGVSSALLLLK